MSKQINRIDAYCVTKCIDCIYYICGYIDCNSCKNNILKDKRWHYCACLHLKPEKEKSCPYFERCEK